MMMALKQEEGWGCAMAVLNDSLKFEVKKHAFFAGFSDDELEEFFAVAQTVVFKARAEIFGQGDAGDSMYILLGGRVKISSFSSAGKETVLTFLGPGDILGEIALLDGGVRTAAAVVLEETRALRVTRGQFIPFIEAHPKIALKIIEVLCERLRRTDLFVEEVATMQSGPRLARALLRLAQSHGRERDGKVLIDLKLSQANLGAHAGLMRENVNRQMKIWEEAGIIETSSGRITILDLPMLELVIEGDE